MTRTLVSLSALTVITLAACGGGNSDGGRAKATATPSAGTVAGAAPSATPGAPAASALTVTSAAFDDGGALPVDFTCSGRGVSPPIAWIGAPSGTRSFALLVDDPDAPLPGGFDHWTAFNIPAAVTALAENSSAEDAGGTSGRNGRQTNVYTGACPPPGSADHHYRFHVYALDTVLPLSTGASKAEVLQAVRGHILAEGLLVGLYKR